MTAVRDGGEKGKYRFKAQGLQLGAGEGAGGFEPPLCGRKRTPKGGGGLA